MHVGLDFGTSNTAVAIVEPNGQTRFLDYKLLGNQTHSYRSLLYFDPEEQEVSGPIEYHAGAEGIEAYLEMLGEGRLIQSFKTHLSSRSLGRTQIGPHAISLDDMLHLFFLRLRQHMERAWGKGEYSVTMGRPVHFAGASHDEDNLAAQLRLEQAAKRCGFRTVQFQLEPIAAALHYEAKLQKEELALVADFGGGTTDYCLMRLGRNSSKTDRSEDIIATGGVGVAGDDLDAEIIDKVVSPKLGKGTRYKEMGREATVPASYFHKLSKWHQLSFLRGERVRAELERLRRTALQPKAIDALIHIIEHNQGFHLHKSVETLKIALSGQETAVFRFVDDEVQIEVPVLRHDFENWIAPKVNAITKSLDQTLSSAGISPQEVDRVFMTGGTAFVPCIRRAFAQRFGVEKIAGGDELMSISSGLALTTPAP